MILGVVVVVGVLQEAKERRVVLSHSGLQVVHLHSTPVEALQPHLCVCVCVFLNIV